MVTYFQLVGVVAALAILSEQSDRRFESRGGAFLIRDRLLESACIGLELVVLLVEICAICPDFRFRLARRLSDIRIFRKAIVEKFHEICDAAGALRRFGFVIGRCAFCDAVLGDTPEENDAFTDEIIDKINATGEAFFSGTTWRGRRAMRVSVVNWRTSENDVDRAVAAARAALAQSHAGSSMQIEG